MIEYCIAATPEDYQAAGALFKEYAASLDIDLAFQHFEDEIKILNQMYARPEGAIILTKTDQQYIACVGIRYFADGIAELKRMYVQPGWQGRGIGATLLEKAIATARNLGYKKIYLDTLSDMTAARRLYEQNGFRQIPAYYHNPNATAVFYELLLSAQSNLG